MPEPSRVTRALRKIQKFLDADARERYRKRKDIHEKTKILKKRINAIKRMLEKELDETKRHRLEDELALIKAKRRKAVEVLKTMREEDSARKKSS